MYESIEYILPKSVQTVLALLPTAIKAGLEEIRIRENRPLEIVYKGRYAFVSAKGDLCAQSSEAVHPTRAECVKLLDLLTNHSVYSYEEELKRGFIAIAGGHRVGLAGRTVLEQGQVKFIRDISSFNIRIAREVLDCGRKILPALLDPLNSSIYHTLVISPPQKGKTTLIRDLARLISYGYWPAITPWRGLKVGIVDERSELAACIRGVPSFDVGPRTDVLDGCPKAEGMMMMIRSMSPEVMVVDEIGRREDAEAIHEAVHAGIRIIATAHGNDLNDIRSRPVLRQLVADEVFGRYVVLHTKEGTPEVLSVSDAQGGQIRC
jgi:stage III sporulation protein AA